MVIAHIQHMLTAPSFINLSRMGKPVERSCPCLIMDAPANTFYSPQGGAVVEGCTCSSEVFLASLSWWIYCVVVRLFVWPRVGLFWQERSKKGGDQSGVLRGVEDCLGLVGLVEGSCGLLTIVQGCWGSPTIGLQEISSMGGAGGVLVMALPSKVQLEAVGQTLSLHTLGSSSSLSILE